MARKRLLPTLIARKAPGQIGGLPLQQTLTAIQLLELHGKLSRAQRMSTAAIFVDLRAAFHHMLREFIFTIREPTTQSSLLRIFDPNEFDIPQLAQDLDIPPPLRAFLHDIHESMWFTMQADDPCITVTSRGTRPGSPLADMGFNLLMTKIMHQIEEGMQNIPDYVHGSQALGLSIPPLAWVDDLTVPIAVTKPEFLIPVVQETVALLHNTFRAHGMTMTFEKGKSEAVLMYRGFGAVPF